ncbi:DUF3800 domain-containing protein [Streptomyces cellulosae]
MSLCYIDEAGNGQTLDPSRPDAPPALVVGGFTVHDSCVKQLTWGFLTVKKTYRPQLGRARHLAEVIHTEVKGADVRKDIRVGNRDRRRAAMLLVDSVLGLLERCNARVLARVWVKQEGHTVNETGVYSTSVGSLTETFQAQLLDSHSRGVMILDSRTKSKNAPNVHCVTTRKYRAGGDLFKGVIESPVFGHSDTHTLLQLADLAVSSLLFPVACHAYLGDVTWNVHCDDAAASWCPTAGPRSRRV